MFFFIIIIIFYLFHKQTTTTYIHKHACGSTTSWWLFTPLPLLHPISFNKNNKNKKLEEENYDFRSYNIIFGENIVFRYDHRNLQEHHYEWWFIIFNCRFVHSFVFVGSSVRSFVLFIYLFSYYSRHTCIHTFHTDSHTYLHTILYVFKTPHLVLLIHVHFVFVLLLSVKHFRSINTL